MIAYKKAIADEISRQSNLYGSLMLKNKRNRAIAMFFHAQCNLMYQMAKDVFKLKQGYFK